MQNLANFDAWNHGNKIGGLTTGGIVQWVPVRFSVSKIGSACLQRQPPYDVHAFEIDHSYQGLRIKSS